MNRIGLIGLMKMELPAYTVRLCDGGFITFGGELYQSADETFGTIGSLDALGEGVGDEVPALELTFLPPGTSAPGDLSQPGFQTSRVRFWVAEYDVDIGAITGTPDLMFDGQLDRTQVSLSRGNREVACSVVSLAERLFELNIGNWLSDTWHQSVWPGELGHSNATGITKQIAWGVARPQ